MRVSGEMLVLLLMNVFYWVDGDRIKIKKFRKKEVDTTMREKREKVERNCVELKRKKE